MKARTTFKEFPSFIGIINYTYKDTSAREGTRQERGEQGQRVHIQSVDPKMLQGLRWDDFLHRGNNKEDLFVIAIISDFLKSPEGRSKFPFPFIVTSK